MLGRSVAIVGLVLLTSCGGSRSGSPAPTGAARERIWRDSWCSLHVGMTSGEVRKVMGKPTNDFEATSNRIAYVGSTVAWSVTFGSDSRVAVLDVDAAGGSSSAGVPCSSERS